MTVPSGTATIADRKRLLGEPDLLPTAVKEFLRAFTSVSLWGTVTESVPGGDVDMWTDDTVMMAFPAQCRDPQAFEDTDQVISDLTKNFWAHTPKGDR
jgi:cytochrome P450